MAEKLRFNPKPVRQKRGHEDVTADVEAAIITAVLDEGMSSLEAARRFIPNKRAITGHQSYVVRHIIDVETGRREERARIFGDLPDPPVTKQQQFDAAVRAHKKALDAQFDAAVRAEVDRQMAVQKRIADLRAADYLAVLKRRKGLMTGKQFKLLQMLAHPDNVLTDDRKSEALNLLEELRPFLLDEAAYPIEQRYRA